MMQEFIFKNFVNVRLVMLTVIASEVDSGKSRSKRSPQLSGGNMIDLFGFKSAGDKVCAKPGRLG